MSYRSFLLFLACLVCCAAAWGQQYTISTFAGNGTAGYKGDQAAATAAELNNPVDVEVDSSGNLYIADTNNNVIRKVSGGNITTVAGDSASCSGEIICTPAGGYSGDAGSPTVAELKAPAAMAVDSNGNIYIADTGNFVIREVSGGKINTIAGDGNSGYQGDGGTATAAEFVRPAGIAVDKAGNVYVSDSGTSTDAYSGFTTTVNLIRRILVSNGNIYSYIGAGGTLTANKLNNPTGLWIDPTADPSSAPLYIADTSNKRVVRYVPTGSNAGFAVIAGNGIGAFGGDGGPAPFAQLNNPQGVAVDSAGNVYIADTTNNRIRKVVPSSDGDPTHAIITTIAGNGRPGYSGDGGPATSAQLQFPRGVAVDSAGNVYIADSGNNVIRVLKPVLPTISTNGVVNGASFQPQISPGAWGSVFGTNFPATTSAGVPLPTSLAGASVLVNGTPANLLFVSPNQINFQVPWELTPGTAASISVTVNGGTSNAVTIPASNVLTAGPAFFFIGNGVAAVENAADYSVNSASHPVATGGTIIAYMNGSGPVSPAVADGTPAPTTGLTNLTSNATAKIGSSPATVQFAGLAPGFISLVQMNIVVPTGLAAGTYPLTVTVNGETTGTPASISVK